MQDYKILVPLCLFDALLQPRNEFGNGGCALRPIFFVTGTVIAACGQMVVAAIEPGDFHILRQAVTGNLVRCAERILGALQDHIYAIGIEGPVEDPEVRVITFPGMQEDEMTSWVPPL